MTVWKVNLLIRFTCPMLLRQVVERDLFLYCIKQKAALIFTLCCNPTSNLTREGAYSINTGTEMKLAICAVMDNLPTILLVIFTQVRLLLRYLGHVGNSKFSYEDTSAFHLFHLTLYYLDIWLFVY